jgi:hypothetical protein
MISDRVSLKESNYYKKNQGEMHQKEEILFVEVIKLKKKNHQGILRFVEFVL